MSAVHLRLFSGALSATALSVACSEPRAPVPLPAAGEVDLARAGEGDVAGTIAGDAFLALDVRVRVAARAGHERVDLLVADRRIERCGLPIAREEVLVWLRFAGRTALSPGTYERLDDDVAHAVRGEIDEHEVSASGSVVGSMLEVHYERPGGRAPLAEHRGIARVEITRAEGGALEGRLRACFADDAHSCVGGHFVATPCLSRIDGRTLREPPGLVDEALEPLPRGAR